MSRLKMDWVAFLGAVGIILMLTGCSSGSSNSNVLAASLRSAPEQITFKSTTLNLSAYVWRNFMPGVGASAPPLMAELRVQTADSSAFPSGLHADAAWVLDGDKVWSASPMTGAPSNISVLPLQLENGPGWPIQDLVDVVVRLRDDTGQTYLIQVRQQKINAVS